MLIILVGGIARDFYHQLFVCRTFTSDGLHTVIKLLSIQLSFGRITDYHSLFADLRANKPKAGRFEPFRDGYTDGFTQFRHKQSSTSVGGPAIRNGK